LDRAAEHLRSNDVHFDSVEHSLVINREDAFGMVLGFTDQRLPNDPRGD
jgi:hypothetical protein